MCTNSSTYLELAVGGKCERTLMVKIISEIRTWPFCMLLTNSYMLILVIKSALLIFFAVFIGFWLAWPVFLGRQYAQHKQQCPVPAELEHDLSAITPPVCLSVGLSRLGPAAATWFRHGKTTYTGVRVLPPARGHRTCVSRQQRKRARYVSHLSVPSLVHRLLFVTRVHPYSSVPKPLSHKRFPFSLPYLFTHNHKSFTCFIALLFSTDFCTLGSSSIFLNEVFQPR